MKDHTLTHDNNLKKFSKDTVSMPSGNLHIKEKSLAAHNFLKVNRPGILFISSYPPRECGIATYSQDLINALETKFGHTFQISVCALETTDEKFQYPNIVTGTFNTSEISEYSATADKINLDHNIKAVVIQHEFGFYNINNGADFLYFIQRIIAPVIIVFHTVLPNPDEKIKKMVVAMVAECDAVVVMTETSKGVLNQDYGIDESKVEVIAHGTHLVSNNSRTFLKKKYGLQGRKVLSTFGLLSSGKSIETTLDAMPEIVIAHPDIMFLIIGKTHPGVIKHEGEKYREMLIKKVKKLHLGKNVTFINQYLELSVLLEYLRLTDIYLFTSKDPNQSVSGTFSYAMSCGCPVISTPIPQAREMLKAHPRLIFNFQQSKELSESVLLLLKNDSLRRNISIDMLHKIAPTAWENSAIAHGRLIRKILKNQFTLQYSVPETNLKHLKQMTTSFGILQFSKINRPDIGSGYTLDDNARALIAACMHYENYQDASILPLMKTYLNFIKFCQQPDGTFLNYVDKHKTFSAQNEKENLEDANGRANWALGYIISREAVLPVEMIESAKEIFGLSALNVLSSYSSRAIALNIKGLYYYDLLNPSTRVKRVINILGERLASMYEHESEKGWMWFESYLTYANSVLPEAMLLAWKSIKEPAFKKIAKESFDFLLSKTMPGNTMKVISNRGWMQKGESCNSFGEQAVDVAYTILAMNTFNEICCNNAYSKKMVIAFQWFLGNNHLHQIMYNPCTGGCYDGLEENQVNLNQGAESTISFLLSEMIIVKTGKTRSASFLSLQKTP
ncbi:hypothetical protein SDC9_63497 [bioreactor metagenome]|uniref:Uncharacterized protein n=1 Tax=bioreactor metagenome TaxID=1076179 RepID=A0A644XLN2_9ZZZZ